MPRSKSMYLVASLLSAAFVQCGGDATPEPENAPPPPAEPAAAAPPPAEGAKAEAPGAAAEEKTAEKTEAAPKAEPLTDEQIAMVTDAANTAEVDLAKLAQKNGKNPKVKKFAGMMISDHTQAKQKVGKLVTKLKITPAESKLSGDLKSDAESQTSKLKELKGADFDKAYIDGQVDAHRKVLDAFNNDLIPNAKDAGLKTLLEEIKPKIEAHLKEAQDIQSALASAPEPAGAKAGTPGASSGAAPGTGGATTKKK